MAWLVALRGGGECTVGVPNVVCWIEFWYQQWQLAGQSSRLRLGCIRQVVNRVANDGAVAAVQGLFLAGWLHVVVQERVVVVLWHVTVSTEGAPLVSGRKPVVAFFRGPCTEAVGALRSPGRCIGVVE